MKKIILLMFLMFSNFIYSQNDSILVSTINIKKANMIFTKYEYLKLEKNSLLIHIENLKKLNVEIKNYNELKILDLTEKLNHQLFLNDKLKQDFNIYKKRYKKTVIKTTIIASVIGIIAILK